MAARRQWTRAPETYVLWLNGAFYSKSHYWQPIRSRIWEIDWYQNEWPWPLFKRHSRSCQSLRHQQLQNYLSYRLPIWYAALYVECRAGAQIIVPESGRGLGHVTPKILAYHRTYLQNYLSYRLQIWYTALYGELRASAQIICAKNGRGLASRSVQSEG